MSPEGSHTTTGFIIWLCVITTYHFLVLVDVGGVQLRESSCQLVGLGLLLRWDGPEQQQQVCKVKL